ncbi:hypothetical protein BJX76DRAFT_337661 [Aspergillus varians]
MYRVAGRAYCNNLALFSLPSPSIRPLTPVSWPRRLRRCPEAHDHLCPIDSVPMLPPHVRSTSDTKVEVSYWTGWRHRAFHDFCSLRPLTPLGTNRQALLCERSLRKTLIRGPHKCMCPRLHTTPLRSSLLPLPPLAPCELKYRELQSQPCSWRS